MKMMWCREFIANKGLSIALLAAFLLAPSSAYSKGWRMMAPERVYDMIKEGSGLWLIDVRSAHSFGKGHIEGSVNITSLELKAKRFPKKKVLVLVDASLGLRNAREAAKALVKNGQENVFILNGGLVGWDGAGLPIAGKSPSETARAVRARDVRWAVENKVPLDILDLREKKEFEKGTVPGSTMVEGKTVAERIEVVRKKLNSGKKDLVSMLVASKTTVLILPSSTRADKVFDKSFFGIKADVRYLEGGYLAWSAKAGRKTTGR